MLALESTAEPLTLGARYLGGQRCRFRVWAPKASKVEVHLHGPQERFVPLQALAHGYFETTLEGVPPGTRYTYRLDGDKDRPDPASRFQPDGVHQPSQVVDPHFTWHDAGWHNLPLEDYVVYELHVGTFTPEGTFDAIIPRLDELKELGVTAIEILPVAQFPGGRNWGYDGVYLYAPQSTYGGPDGLRRLVDACHQRGLAAVLDVVYNHLGPEGNYLWDYGHYFTDRYKTPWGAALNYDGPHSDDVRRFFLENALYWQTEFHFDALRLDAVHAITDFSARPFLQELAEVIELQSRTLRKPFYLIAESDLNDTRVIRSRACGGFGHDAQWSDDFHHAVHSLLTGETNGYYEDWGAIEHLVRAYRDGFAYGGDYSVHRRRRHGNCSKDLPGRQFVICTQNHDQVGNRMLGERLTALLSFEALKVAAGLTILSPYLPMLFMGEEYGEPAPFLFFTSHGDKDLIEAVRKGRTAEFASFKWQGEVPDPQDEATFARSRLHWDLRNTEQHGVLRAFYRELLKLRREVPSLLRLSKELLDVRGVGQAIVVRRWTEGDEVFKIFNMSGQPLELTPRLPAGTWRKLLDSAAPRWRGPGSSLPDTLTTAADTRVSLAPHAFVLYQRSTT
ncbi:MAG: malto-oligosyltrehalose trehalohydrolase [Gemmataceae bacterium]